MKNHDYRIDRLRLLACFGVVMLHSSVGAGAGDLALNALFRFSVPVFVIISGWFQLSGPVQPKRLVSKCARLFGKMLLWSGIYLLVRRLSHGTWPGDWIGYLLTEPVHLWYLYATMGLYLLTPALWPFVRSAEKGEYQYALALCFGLGSVAVTLVRLGWVPMLAVILDKSKLPQMLGFLFLYLLGGYFRRFGLEHRRRWLAVGILCGAVSVIASAMDQREQLLSFLSPNVVLSGAACFVLYMTREPLPERYRPLLRRSSECTMGVYLLHMMISSAVTPLIQHLRAVLFPAGYMALRCGCVFTVTFAVIWLISLVKPLKKVLL